MTKQISVTTWRLNPFVRERLDRVGKVPYLLGLLVLYLLATLAQLSFLYRSFAWIQNDLHIDGRLRCVLQQAFCQQALVMGLAVIVVLPVFSATQSLWERARRRLIYVQVTPMSKASVTVGLFLRDYVMALALTSLIMPLGVVAVGAKAITASLFVVIVANLLLVSALACGVGCAVGLGFNTSFAGAVGTVSLIVGSVVGIELYHYGSTRNIGYSRYEEIQVLARNAEEKRILFEREAKERQANEEQARRLQHILESTRSDSKVQATVVAQAATQRVQAAMQQVQEEMAKIEAQRHEYETEQRHRLFGSYYRLNTSRELGPFWMLSPKSELLSGSAGFAQELYDRSESLHKVLDRWSGLDASFDKSSSLKRDQLPWVSSSSKVYDFLKPATDESIVRQHQYGYYRYEYAPDMVFWPTEDLWLFMKSNWQDALYFRPLAANLSEIYTQKYEAYVLLLLLESPPTRRVAPIPQSSIEGFARYPNRSVERILPLAIKHIGEYGGVPDIEEVADVGGTAQGIKDRISHAGETWAEIEWLIEYYKDGSLRQAIHRTIAPYTFPRPAELDNAFRDELRRQISTVVDRPLGVAQAFPSWLPAASEQSQRTLDFRPDYRALIAGWLAKLVVAIFCVLQVRRIVFDRPPVYLPWYWVLVVGIVVARVTFALGSLPDSAPQELVFVSILLVIIIYNMPNPVFAFYKVTAQGALLNVTILLGACCMFVRAFRGYPEAAPRPLTTAAGVVILFVLIHQCARAIFRKNMAGLVLVGCLLAAVTVISLTDSSRPSLRPVEAALLVCGTIQLSVLCVAGIRWMRSRASLGMEEHAH